MKIYPNNAPRRFACKRKVQFLPCCLRAEIRSLELDMADYSIRLCNDIVTLIIDFGLRDFETEVTADPRVL